MPTPRKRDQVTLPESTRKLLSKLIKDMGIDKSSVVSLAIVRLAQEEAARPKTRP